MSNITFVALSAAICFVFFAAICFVGNTRLRKRVRQLVSLETNVRSLGVAIEGRVVHHDHPSIFSARSLVYGYQHEGQHYQGKQRVTRRDFYRLEDGMPVTVLYLPHDPSQARLRDVKNVEMDFYQQTYLANTYIYLLIIYMISALILFAQVAMSIFR